MAQHRTQEGTGNPTASHQVLGFREEARTRFLGTQDRLRSSFQKMGLTGYRSFPRITLKTNFSDPFHLQNWRLTPAPSQLGEEGGGGEGLETWTSVHPVGSSRSTSRWYPNSLVWLEDKTDSGFLKSFSSSSKAWPSLNKRNPTPRTVSDPFRSLLIYLRAWGKQLSQADSGIYGRDLGIMIITILRLS